MGKIVALVPMKGHSERVPKKNLKLFDENPLCYYVLKNLSKSSYIKSIIVNTDCPEIEAYCSNEFEKVKIHRRPKSIQGDFVSMNHIIEYDLQNSDSHHYLQTHASNPLVSTASFEKAIDTYFESIHSGADSVFSVNAFQSRFYRDQMIPINHNPLVLGRTQDLEPLYEENSCIYIFSRDSFNKSSKRIGENPNFFVMDQYEALDIDTPKDFKFAEIIHKGIKKCL